MCLKKFMAIKLIVQGFSNLASEWLAAQPQATQKLRLESYIPKYLLTAKDFDMDLCFVFVFQTAVSQTVSQSVSGHCFPLCKVNVYYTLNYADFVSAFWTKWIVAKLVHYLN